MRSDLRNNEALGALVPSTMRKCSQCKANFEPAESIASIGSGTILMSELLVRSDGAGLLEGIDTLFDNSRSEHFKELA